MGGMLVGKVAVITGGCSGIGAAMVDAFLREGAQVLIADLRPLPDRLKQETVGGRLHHLGCDVSLEADITSALKAAADLFGGLDILCNNAGIPGTQARIAEMDVEGWDAAMALMLRGVMLGTKHALPLMRARGGGSIINTASIAAMRPAVYGAAYSTAKAAVLHFTHVAALEYAPDNVRVNAISPGIIPSQSFTHLFDASPRLVDRLLPEISRICHGAQPLPRAGAPGDVGRVAAFLASDNAAFITGVNIPVEGGITLLPPGSLDRRNPQNIIAALTALAHNELARQGG